MKSRLKVVIDTNVLLVSISSKSKYHWIYQKLLDNEFDLFITPEILLEYEEIISQKYNPAVAKNVVRTLLLLPNVYQSVVYHKWNLIEADLDDNKFVDCAVQSNSHLLVTHDKHFDILHSVDFPKLNIANIEEFKTRLKKPTRR